MLETLFNPETKVYRHLEALLPKGVPEVAHFDRLSEADEEGISSQVGRSTRGLVEAGDADVQAYVAIPDEAWREDRGDLHARYGITWLRLGDVHPNARGRESIGGVVLIGRTLFCRLTTSAVVRQVQRADGDDENAYSLFVCATSATYAGSVRLFRWSDDARRAGRDTANWATIVRRLRERGQLIQFGTQVYHPGKDEILLSLLGSMAAQDDVTRRKSLGGGRLQNLLAGGAAMAEAQMPYGYHHQRRPDGRRLRVPGKGFVAVADWNARHVVRTAWSMHAAGDSYIAIGRYLAAQRVPRRGTRVAEGSTYADLLDRPGDLGLAAKNFFVVASRRPATELDLYLGKVTLMETGTWPYRVANDIAQRGVQVAGLTPTYTGPHDARGYFDLALNWGWPRDAVSGEELPRWGLTPEQLQASRERLLRELRAPRRRPGTSHGLPTARALSEFGTWATDDGRYQGEPTQYGVMPRQGLGGRTNCIVMHRAASLGTHPDGRPRGWQNEARSQHVAWTFNLAELCGDVGHRLRELGTWGPLHPDNTVPVTLVRSSPGVSARQRRLDELHGKLRGAREQAAELTAEEEGLRTAAGHFAAQGDMDKFTRYDALADAKSVDAARAAASAERLAQRIDMVEAAPEEDETVAPANLTTLAYLTAGLLRAAGDNGRGPRNLARVARDVLTGWRFSQTDSRTLRYEVTITLPLVSGGSATHQLAGQVRNLRVRSARFGADGQLMAAAILRDGRSVDEVARMAGIARRTVLIRHLMPWLRDHGVTARGAKCALVDHPVRTVPAVLHAHVAGIEASRSVRSWPSALRQHLVDTYTTPDLAWGDCAVPDDTAPVQQLVTTLSQPHLRASGTTLTEAALLIGRTEKETRELVVPARRAAGFNRPSYLEYVPDTGKARVRAISCPHQGCPGVCDVVVLLPEVATSGYGVLCSTCRRAPAIGGAWSRVAFAPDYLQPFTRSGSRTGSLRTRQRTAAGPSPTPWATGQDILSAVKSHTGSTGSAGGDPAVGRT